MLYYFCVLFSFKTGMTCQKWQSQMYVISRKITVCCGMTYATALFMWWSARLCLDTIAIRVFLVRRKRSQQSTIDFPILAYGEGESGRPMLKAEL